MLAPQAWAHRDPHELLRDEALIRYDRRLGGGQAAERYLRRAGIVPRERFEISSLAAIAMLVGRGVGVSIAPDAATAWWPTLPVARLPLPQSSEARRFGMVWPRTSPRTRAIEVLVDHARRVMAAKDSPRPAVASRSTPRQACRLSGTSCRAWRSGRAGFRRRSMNASAGSVAANYSGPFLHSRLAATRSAPDSIKRCRQGQSGRPHSANRLRSPRARGRCAAGRSDASATRSGRCDGSRS